MKIKKKSKKKIRCNTPILSRKTVMGKRCVGCIIARSWWCTSKTQCQKLLQTQVKLKLKETTGVEVAHLLNFQMPWRTDPPASLNNFTLAKLKKASQPLYSITSTLWGYLVFLKIPFQTKKTPVSSSAANNIKPWQALLMVLYPLIYLAITWQDD